MTAAAVHWDTIDMARNDTRHQEPQPRESPEVEPHPQAQPDVDAVELTDEAAELVQRLQDERDEAVEARKRALADFRNFQRRSEENEHRAMLNGAIGVVRALLPALDHFDLALSQKPEQLTVEQLLGGVKLVRQEIYQALESRGVQRIEPVVGEPFDPNRHEAMMRQASPDVEPDGVVQVLQPGYAMGDQVLRPAKVAVAADDTGPDAGARSPSE